MGVHRQGTRYGRVIWPPVVAAFALALCVIVVAVLAVGLARAAGE